MLDILPIDRGRAVESFLRLDHIQPIVKHNDSIELTKYRLSDDALYIFNEWLDWFIYEEFDQEGILSLFQQWLKTI